MRDEKGITLIALILAILVLLILAGISVSLMLSNEDEGNVITNSNVDDSMFPDSDIYQNIQDNVFDNVDTDDTVPEVVGGNEIENTVSNESVLAPTNEVPENLVDNTVANTVR